MNCSELFMGYHSSRNGKLLVLLCSVRDTQEIIDFPEVTINLTLLIIDPDPEALRMRRHYTPFSERVKNT